MKMKYTKLVNKYNSIKLITRMQYTTTRRAKHNIIQKMKYENEKKIYA